MTYLKSSVSTETAQKEDAVVKMSPIGGNEEYETILYLRYFDCDLDINCYVLRISKASSNPEAVDWKIRSKTDRENIATSQCCKFDFFYLLLVLRRTP